MDNHILLRGWILGGAVLAAAVSVVAAAGLRTHSAPAPARTVSTAEAAPVTGYTVGQWEGLLAVFAAGGKQPLEVYDIYIAAFPHEEQVRLTAGIPAADAEALARLLEDYTS